MIELDDVKLYDVKESAEILNVHPQTIRSYVKRGMLKGRKVGRKQYITADALKCLVKGSGKER